MSTTLGDSTKPVYLFEWADGTARQTDELAHADAAPPAAIEELAAFGRADPECDVTLVGYTT